MDKLNSNLNILSETTLKLKTKVVLFSSVSLFIGLTEVLPTKLSLIGLDLTSNPKTLGWFLFAITVVLLLNFLVVFTLDYIKYFKNNILSKKNKSLRGDTLGMTFEEIDEESYRECYDAIQDDGPKGTLGEEAESIHRQIKALDYHFDQRHLNFTNIIEFFFNVVLSVMLSITGLVYLFCFLE